MKCGSGYTDLANVGHVIFVDICGMPIYIYILLGFVHHSVLFWGGGGEDGRL
jgi:hypothetical protein